MRVVFARPQAADEPRSGATHVMLKRWFSTMHGTLILHTTEATGQAQRPRSSPRPRQLAAKLGMILRAWLMAAARWYRIRRAIHEVAQRDDRMLKDIGIHRSEIERAVRCGRAR
jgi:uncharacterized protein YjiS (DUF1127 family)